MMQTSCSSIETSSGGLVLKRKRNGGGDTFEWDELEEDFVLDGDEEMDFGSAINDYGWEEKEFDASWVFVENFDTCFADEEVDLDSKRVALKVSQSVVLLLSGTGEKKLFSCSGTIIECEYEPETGEFIATVLTSASILRFPSVYGDACLVPEITVHVYLTEGEPLEGEVHHCDLHYNIAIIKFRSKHPLPKAILRSTFNPVHYAADEPKHDSNFFSLCYGDKVIAMARVGEDRNLILKPGVFSSDRCPLDCQELLLTTCKTHRGYIGGPLINCDGEVIGIIFHYQDYAAFLPINIVSRWLEHLRQKRNVPQFSLGMDLANLCEADVHDLDRIIRKFPCFNIYNGLIVKKVKKEFPAHCAGIVDKDIIIECDGEMVKGSIQFWEMMWDRASQDVMLYVFRARDLTFSRIKVVTGEPRPDGYSRWPVTSKEIRWRKMCKQVGDNLPLGAIIILNYVD